MPQLGMQKLRGVESAQEGNGGGKQHGVKRALNRAQYKGNHGKLRFEIVGATGGLPNVIGLNLTLISDFSPKRLYACLRVGVLQMIKVKRSRTIEESQAVVFLTDYPPEDLEIEIPLPANRLCGAEAQ